MAGPNTSHAVRHQRSEAHDSLDDFPTPPWATRAILAQIATRSADRLADLTARDPCANRGHMVRPLQEYFGAVYAQDVHDYGAGFEVADYLFPSPIAEVDWTLINPPFRLAQQFIERALATSRIGVAALVRTGFLEGIARWRDLYSVNPPSAIFQFAERCPMAKATMSSATGTATSYCWLVWFKQDLGRHTLFEWLEPCRAALEVPGDYPSEPDGLAQLWPRKLGAGVW